MGLQSLWVPIVQSITFLSFLGGCIIGNGVRIGAHVVIIPYNHLFEDPSVQIFKQGSSQQGVFIEDDVWIGAHVTLTVGVRIGPGSDIRAGAVLSRDTPPTPVSV